MKKKCVVCSLQAASVLIGLLRINMHEEKKSKQKEAADIPDGAIPAYLMDREGQSHAKALNNMIKQKRKEKAVRHH